jgi:hypothetical protein
MSLRCVPVREVDVTNELANGENGDAIVVSPKSDTRLLRTDTMDLEVEDGRSDNPLMHAVIIKTSM